VSKPCQPGSGSLTPAGGPQASHPSGSQTDLVIEALPDEWVRVRVGGNEYVIAAACPHRKGRLVHGYVNVRKLLITCPLHGSTFDLATGCSVAGPSTDPLPVRRARAYRTDTGPAAEAQAEPDDPHPQADTAAQDANQRQDGRSAL
jgi:nitrite reductase/ring-hydroxylating ferredoxin subunit